MAHPRDAYGRVMFPAHAPGGVPCSVSGQWVTPLVETKKTSRAGEVSEKAMCPLCGSWVSP